MRKTRQRKKRRKKRHSSVGKRRRMRKRQRMSASGRRTRPTESGVGCGGGGGHALPRGAGGILVTRGFQAQQNDQSILGPKYVPRVYGQLLRVLPPQLPHPAVLQRRPVQPPVPRGLPPLLVPPPPRPPPPRRRLRLAFPKRGPWSSTKLRTPPFRFPCCPLPLAVSR